MLDFDQDPWIELDSIDAFRAYAAGPAGELFPWRVESVQRMAAAVTRQTLVGFCYPCGLLVNFEMTPAEIRNAQSGQEPNWRESMTCPQCGLFSRLRMTQHLMRSVLGIESDARIYLTERVTAFYRWMSDRYPHTQGSEFSLDGVPGGTAVKIQGQITQNQDLTRLSRPSGETDLIVCLDVLEHVPEYYAGLSEMVRCLAPGGSLILSAPFDLNSEEHLVRARIDEDGEVEHLMEPEYHGDPTDQTGVLCFYYFGWQLLSELRALGLEQVRVVLGQSRSFGYLGWGNSVVVGTKPA